MVAVVWELEIREAVIPLKLTIATEDLKKIYIRIISWILSRVSTAMEVFIDVKAMEWGVEWKLETEWWHFIKSIRGRPVHGRTGFWQNT